MDRRTDASAGTVLAVALLMVILATGVWLRLEDPLSSDAMGAEDPYTHVVFVKEHLRRGYFDDVPVLGTSLYPPGLHAFTGIFAPLAGVDLYEFARFSPAFFGALSILGMAMLAWRLGGPAAGLAAGLITAVVPEHIARSALFFPTMVDLALLPAFFLLFLLASEGNRGAMVFAFAVIAVLAYTHPWVVPLAAGIAAIYVALRVLRGEPLLGERAPDEPAPVQTFQNALRRLALPAGIVAVSMAIGSVARWDHGNTGIAVFLAELGPLSFVTELEMSTPILFVFLVGVLGAVAASGVLLGAVAAVAIARVPRAARAAGAWALGLVAVLVVWNLGQAPPPLVYYESMLGVVPIALALLGLALAFGRPTALGDMGIALAGVMFPFTAIKIFEDVFDAQYWPSRAVVYLVLGIALLCAVSVAYAVGMAARFVAARRTARWAAPAAMLASIMLLAGAVTAAPATHEPWYRLYNDEHFAAFERTADMMNDDPKMRVVVASWQPGLMLKTLADPYQTRYGPKYYAFDDYRQRIHDEDPKDRLYVLVDRFAMNEKYNHPETELSFLDTGQYELVLKTSDDQFRLYRFTG
jgi:hypothetical protein